MLMSSKCLFLICEYGNGFSYVYRGHVYHMVLSTKLNCITKTKNLCGQGNLYAHVTLKLLYFLYVIVIYIVCAFDFVASLLLNVILLCFTIVYVFSFASLYTLK